MLFNLEWLGALGRVSCHCSRFYSPRIRTLVSFIKLFRILVIKFLVSNANNSHRCINSRRRRRRGVAPMYGTAWMAAPPPYGQQQQYSGAHAPPMYSPPGVVPQQTGNTFNSNDGYYGHHQSQGQNNDIELQQPASAYQRGGENVYQAPTGPPPGKKSQGDGVIR